MVWGGREARMSDKRDFEKNNLKERCHFQTHNMKLGVEDLRWEGSEFIRN
jgi:hypothetical protein